MRLWESSTISLSFKVYCPAASLSDCLTALSSLFPCHQSGAAFILTNDVFAKLQGDEILQPKVHQGILTADGFRFAIVVARWNDFLTAKLSEGAIDALERLGADEDSVEIFKVPGAFEIPLTAQKVAQSGRFDAVICIGVVIRGETPHFDYVAGEAAKGVTNASLQSGVPVLFGVVTADTLEQAINRAGVKAGNKGFEAAMSAVELVNLYQTMDGEAGKKEKVFPHVV
jgi:6,7-dimethyl-8-ribityllumazine synthase